MNDYKSDKGDWFTVEHFEDHLMVEMWYQRPRVNYVEVGLVDVRATDNIRIHYDFDRDGWVIEQATVSEWSSDEEFEKVGEGWTEVAFAGAYALTDP